MSMAVSFQWAGVPGSLTGQGRGRAPAGVPWVLARWPRAARGGHCRKDGPPQTGPRLLACGMLLLERGSGTEPQMPPHCRPCACTTGGGLGPKLTAVTAHRTPGLRRGRVHTGHGSPECWARRRGRYARRGPRGLSDCRGWGRSRGPEAYASLGGGLFFRKENIK